MIRSLVRGSDLPFLGLPMGPRDWENKSRLFFLCSIEEVLNSYGWRPGWDLKMGSLPIDGWAGKVCEDAVDRGWGFVWHPQWQVTLGTGQKKPETIDNLRRIAREARTFRKEFGLQALVLHCDMAQYGAYGPDAGLERYQAKVGAAQVRESIENQMEVYAEINDICGGILSLENVDTCLFSDTPTAMPTYNAGQIGWGDVIRMCDEVNIASTFDGEHYYGALNFLVRDQDCKDLSTEARSGDLTADEQWLVDYAGYLWQEGYIPQATWEPDLREYVTTMCPSVFHFGGSLLAVNEEGKTETHIEIDTDDETQCQDLLFQIDYIQRTEALGAVIEVVGLDSGGATWSKNRSLSDNIAKQRCTLTVADAIGKMKEGIWKLKQ